jgi:uncharacterized protein YndB with AHSA1/START domain
MIQNGKIIAPNTLRFERLLPGPVEQVWEYLTDSEKRGKWLAKGDMELFAGGKVTLHFFHASLSPVQDSPPEKYKDYACGDTFTGTVLECKPPYLLTFTWSDHSEVTFELSPKGNQVLLHLTHKKLASDTETRISIASGWHTHLDIFSDFLNGKIPKGFWEVHTLMEEVYTKLLNE